VPFAPPLTVKICVASSGIAESEKLSLPIYTHILQSKFYEYSKCNAAGMIRATTLATPMPLNITLNGSPHPLAANTSIAELLADLGYAEKRVAIERNGAIVPRSVHGSTYIEAGDQLEIVQAIGGG